MTNFMKMAFASLNKNFRPVFYLLFLFALGGQSVSRGCDDPIQESHDTGRIDLVGQMAVGRAGHTATLLDSGKVLIIGGFTGDETIRASTETYDPVKREFSKAERLNTERSGHSATSLPDGKVLIAGGYNGSYLNSAEIYDPVTGLFRLIGKMMTHRSEHAAVLLDNGKVLLVGGVGTGWKFLASAEIYDPETETFSTTGSMLSERESHTATLLKNGKVLITGGHKGRRSDILIYSSAELYDPRTGKFEQTSDLVTKRHKHDAVRIPDGRVLIIGGSDERDSRGVYQTAEIYLPTSGRFEKINNMNSPRYKLRQTSVVLSDGNILIAGGGSRAEVFDPSTGTFTYASGNFESVRLFSTATLLKNGEVLIVGGYDDRQAMSPRAWIYRS